MAVASPTFLYFPPSMVRLCETATEEIGGILTFTKLVDKEGRKILQLRRTELVAGTPAEVDPSELYHQHKEDPQWVIFHTHPPANHYNGFSDKDLNGTFKCALTEDTTIPKVSHILISDKMVYYMIVTPNAYGHIRQLASNYKAFRTGVSDEDVATEFMEGMWQMFTLTETFIRTHAQERDVEASHILNAIRFLPDDAVTSYMLSDPETTYVRNFTDRFLAWFVSRIPPELRQANIKELAEQRVQALKTTLTDPSLFGLFYSWVTPKQEFLAAGGVFYLLDGGRMYDNYVEIPAEPYNLNADILPHLFGEPDDMIIGGGGNVPLLQPTNVDPAVLRKISDALTPKHTPHISPLPQQVASARKRRTRRAKRYSRRR